MWGYIYVYFIMVFGSSENLKHLWEHPAGQNLFSLNHSDKHFKCPLCEQNWHHRIKPLIGRVLLKTKLLKKKQESIKKYQP